MFKEKASSMTEFSRLPRAALKYGLVCLHTVFERLVKFWMVASSSKVTELPAASHALLRSVLGSLRGRTTYWLLALTRFYS